MKSGFRLFQRHNGIYFCEDRQTGRQRSLLTRDKTEAHRLVHAMNEAQVAPLLNRQIARAYLVAADESMVHRTWRDVLDALIQTKQGENARRWDVFRKDKAIQALLELKVIDTRAEHFLAALKAGSVSTNVYLRRVHNFALDMDWILKAVIPKRQWPKIVHGEKRAITQEEHQKIVARELNPERRLFYELCWALGGSQGDIANLKAEDIDWKNRILAYARKKTHQPALIRIDAKLEQLLRALPVSGPLFPYLRTVEAKDRANEFRQRCHGLGVRGVSLHSYRYAWAERARQCGYPERYAQEALGHGSKAVHRAYAKSAKVLIPSLDEWQNNQAPQNRVVAIEFKNQIESWDAYPEKMGALS